MPSTPPVVGRPIRVGVVGLGQIAELVLPAYLARDDVTVVAACDRDPDRLARWRAELGDADLSTDVADVLAATRTSWTSSCRPRCPPRSRVRGLGRGDGRAPPR